MRRPRDRALDHGRDLRLVRHVAGDVDLPVTGRGQLPDRGTQRVLVDIDKNDRGARLGECLRGRGSDAGTGAGDKGDLGPSKSSTGFMFSFLLSCMLGRIQEMPGRPAQRLMVPPSGAPRFTTN